VGVGGGGGGRVGGREEGVEKVGDEVGERAVGVRADVTDLESLEIAVDEAARLLGGLDAIVAVAGKSMTGTVTTGTPQRWRELIDLNLIGPLATVRYAARHFPPSGRRDVVVVGSAGA